MSNKEILRKLHELEVELQQTQRAKANLEVDFQHLLQILDQLKPVQRNNVVAHEEHAVVCG